MREAVATLIDPASLRWISWSHFEVDECGALNQWLAAAPNAVPVCGELGAMINIADFSNRPPRGLKPGEILETGRHRFRFVPTPHLPHGWDAGVLFEETDRLLLCSDLMHQLGNVEPVTSGDVVGRYRHAFETWRRCSRGCWRPCTARRSSETAQRPSSRVERSFARSRAHRRSRSDRGQARFS
jgi:flavorubredoxin